MVYGPNTNNNSLITMLELETGYAVRHIRRMLDSGVSSSEISWDAMRRWNAQLQTDIAGISVWRSDCGGYYRSTSGLNVTQFPYTMTRYGEMLAMEDRAAYVER
jgi:hypothetical protein